MALNLPENPTPQQLNGICLAIVRQVFEDSATNYRPVDPPEGVRWKGLYTVGDQDFYVEYDGTDLTKWPVGGGQDG